MPLEPERALREQWVREAAEFVQAQIDGLAAAPASGPEGRELEDLLETLPVGIPDQPIDFAQALDRIGRAASVGLQPGGPGYLAYIPGGGLFASALAGFVSLSLNRYTGLSAASPAMARFERSVIELFLRELGLPADGTGILTSGGSMANLSAVVAARVDAFGGGGDFSLATMYVSSQAHGSVAKAARLAGIPAANVRVVPAGTDLRMDPGALGSVIAADRAAGFRPFLAVASAGTTNTGSIDPLAAIGELSWQENLWYHVDGAYGGMFAFTEAGRTKLAGIELADSVTLDPHKGMFLPYGCGALLVRDVAPLARSHSYQADYLQDLAGSGPPSPADLGPELSRNDRGLLVWLPLALHGVDAFRRALQDKLDLAGFLCEGLRSMDVEVPVEPQLSIVAFRLFRRANESLACWNGRNKRWLGRINGRRRVHLSSTLLPVEGGEAFTLRACILSFRTDRARVQMALEDIQATAEG
ncbi:MAG: pyridoxal phosphate-dependent decarboxylase family protein [Actinomycetota bacterium]